MQPQIRSVAGHKGLAEATADTDFYGSIGEGQSRMLASQSRLECENLN